MLSQVEVTIPSTATSTTPKAHTLYNISLRLPLRSYNVQKRYSEFSTLHANLLNETSAPPPAPLPAKSWFTSTTSSPQFTEERRKGLETYLQAINQAPDDRWRNTSAWRTFLNLPSSVHTSRPGAASNLHAAIAGNGAPISDPHVWLDQHRDLKGQLHDARLSLTRRDQASTTQTQHEASAQAKKSLVRAGTMIITLERGLQEMTSVKHAGEKLGEGEVRRRRDLIASAKKEREGLERLQSAMAAKSALDRQVASADKKDELLNAEQSANGWSRSTSYRASGGRTGGGRVLGKETDRTRELDNRGVLQLQRQMMEEQDEDVSILAQAVARQKELGIQIQEELEVQNEMLGMLDEDVTRVQGKIDVARKRVADIS